MKDTCDCKQNDNCCDGNVQNCCSMTNMHHKKTGLMVLIFLGILLLAIGEYKLYRSQVALNMMMSEGFMEIKEQNKTRIMQEPTKTEIMNETTPAEKVIR